MYETGLHPSLLSPFPCAVLETTVTTSLADVRARLPELTQRDQHRLSRRADRAAALRDARARERAFGQILAELDQAEALVAARRQSVPVISYPPELPITAKKDEIAAAIRDHQVVVVAGETGSGKTTQLPKICLELGRGVTGQIGHTQPRRIAARTVSARIAEELGTELGTTVGYQVRFNDNSSDETLVKLMTDGILLTEMQRDRRLLRYDTLIIDEAHERSLNIDFILGYLKRLLPGRPDLKVIITSATIDPQRFSEAFGGAPVVEVSGRTYPVEVRYRPVADPDRSDEEPRDQAQAICAAVDELSAAGPGDILVFLSGEREIRDTADALKDRAGPAGQAGGLEVLPMYARLSAAEQYRVFQPHRGRRVVLATNVAETSLTVPGIRYVVDPGTARISRYSYRTKVQRLPIEPISQASANQRKGRCGRTSDGICIRLYSEEDFASRPEFTDPEILRTNLASVILRMAALDLGEMADFPFVDPPEERNVADGVRLLEELGAFAPAASGRDTPPDRAQRRPPRAGTPPPPRRGRLLSDVGRKLAELPVDPRIGRMIIEAGRNGCVREVLIIAAALSIQDPRERPADAREAADAMHARFTEPGSDFLAFLHLWDYLRAQQRTLSSSAFRRMCRREYLHYLRVREWQDLYGQLRQAAADLGITLGTGRSHGGRENGQASGDDRRRVTARRTPRTGRAPVTVTVTGTARTPGARIPFRPAWPGRYMSHCCPACCRTSACGTPTRRPGASAARSPNSLVRAEPGSPCSPTRRWPGNRRPGWSSPNWSRRHACGAAPPPLSSRSGPSRWRRIWFGAPTASRTGTPGAARPWRWRRSPCTACPSSPRARSATGGSTRPRPGTCSSAMPSWRATGRPGTGSSATTGSCSPTRRNGSAGPAGAASSWTPRCSMTSTISGSRPR